MNEAERLTQLEERYSHLQHHMCEQDKVMLALSDELNRVRRELSQLRGHVMGGHGGAEDASNERPPHY